MKAPMNPIAWRMLQTPEGTALLLEAARRRRIALQILQAQAREMVEKMSDEELTDSLRRAVTLVKADLQKEQPDA